MCCDSEDYITNKRDALKLEAAIPETIVRPFKTGPPEKS
jgi:hypothetical protein